MSDYWQTQGSGRGAVGNPTPGVPLLVGAGHKGAAATKFMPKHLRAAAADAGIQASKVGTKPGKK